MRTLAALLLLITLSLPAHAGRLPVVLLEHLDNDVLALSIEESELASIPDWQPGKGPVPLSVDSLIEKVRSWALKIHPDFDDVRFLEIVLKPIESPRYGTRWHYLVAIQGIADGQPTGRKIFLAVLFNGKIVHGVLEPKV